MDLRDKVILVTGVTGFIGSRLAQRLLEEGASVRGLVRGDAEVPGVDLRRGDLTRPDTVRDAAKGVDMIVHTAVEYTQDFDRARAVTVEGTRVVVEAALAENCERLVHVSTGGVYNVEGLEVVDETAPTWPFDIKRASVYGAVKAEAERVVFDGIDRGLDAVILRPHNVIGGHPRSLWAAGTAKGLRAGTYKLPGDGTNHWPYVHVDNFVDAIIAALTIPEAAGQAYTIVDGQTTWNEYLGHFLEWLNVEPPVQGPPRSPYSTWKGRMNTDKAARELGYSPRVTYEEALAETEAFLREAGIIQE